MTNHEGQACIYVTEAARASAAKGKGDQTQITIKLVRMPEGLGLSKKNGVIAKVDLYKIENGKVTKSGHLGTFTQMDSHGIQGAHQVGAAKAAFKKLYEELVAPMGVYAMYTPTQIVGAVAEVANLDISDLDAK